MLLPIGLAICSVVAKTVPNISEKDKSKQKLLKVC